MTQITVRVGDITRHIATISIGRNKDEFFYSPREASSFDVGWDFNCKRYAGRIDHISFHQDGTIHIKYKNDNRAKNGRFKPPLRKEIGRLLGGFLPSNGSTYTPLLIDSVYEINETSILAPNADSGEKANWEFADIDQFSIFVFLAESGKKALEILNKPDFQHIYAQKSFVEVDINGKWKLVIFLVANTLPVFNEECFEKCGVEFGGSAPSKFGRNLVVPNESVLLHFAYGRSEWVLNKVQNE
jgi:hypothetical protein